MTAIPTQTTLIEYLDDAERLLSRAANTLDAEEYRASVRGAYSLIDVVRYEMGWNVDDCTTELGYVRAIRNIMIHVPIHFSKIDLDVVSTGAVGPDGKPVFDIRLDQAAKDFVIVPKLDLDEAITANNAKNAGTRREFTATHAAALRKTHERYLGNLREIGLQAIREARHRLGVSPP